MSPSNFFWTRHPSCFLWRQNIPNKNVANCLIECWTQRTPNTMSLIIKSWFHALVFRLKYSRTQRPGFVYWLRKSLKEGPVEEETGNDLPFHCLVKCFPIPCTVQLSSTVSQVDATPIEVENKGKARRPGNISKLSLYYSLCVRQLMEGRGRIFGRGVVTVLYWEWAFK